MSRSESDSLNPARACPMCKKPVMHEYRPFCSKRCADLDLGNWLRGVYALPAVEDGGEPADDYPQTDIQEPN